MTFLGVPTPLWGGVIGSSLTYAATYLRERRKLDDAYRAPQRDVIGKIVAASHELKVCASDMVDQAGLTGRQTSMDAALASIRAFERAILGLEDAFAVGKITVVDAACYEQMQVAYNEYSQLRRRTNFAEMVQNPVQSFTNFIIELNKYSDILDGEVVKLVNISKDRLSPTQTRKNKKAVTAAQERLMTKYGESVKPPQSPTPETAQG
ncbi:hypothetical protein [Nocardia sp. CA-119907]|uniref:hypothetical protein n=1 Tax=Nocardia sp. CA-119907 TaxID=3239973 RepID=UPI003D99CF89